MRQASARTTSGMMYGSRMRPPSTAPQRGRLWSSSAAVRPSTNLKITDKNGERIVVAIERDEEVVRPQVL